MKKFLLTGCAAALMASFALPAGAAPLAKSRFLNPEPLHYAPKADGPRFATVTPEAASMALRPFRAPVPEQTATSDNFGYLDSPKGEIWFYTLDLVTTEVKHEAYTESFVSGFKVTVFDGSFNEIGKSRILSNFRKEIPKWLRSASVPRLLRSSSITTLLMRS